MNGNFAIVVPRTSDLIFVTLVGSWCVTKYFTLHYITLQIETCTSPIRQNQYGRFREF